MDKNRITNFTQWARTSLMDMMKEKFHKCNEEGIIKESVDMDNIECYTVAWFNRLVSCKCLKSAGVIKGSFEILNLCDWLSEIIPNYYGSNLKYMEVLVPSQKYVEEFFFEADKYFTEADFAKAEVPGWMYQFFNAGKKARVFEELQDNIKVSKESIPAATQLFTHRWIAAYLIDNSLGRILMDVSGNRNIKNKLTYYIDGDYIENKNVKSAEEVRFLDPCMGSGNFLTYAFDVFYDYYKSQGASIKDIPRKIIENNLYGMDIDNHALELTSFSLVLKALQKDKDFLNITSHKKLNMNLYIVVDSSERDRDVINESLYFQGKVKNELLHLIEALENGSHFGSLIRLENLDYKAMEESAEKYYISCNEGSKKSAISILNMINLGKVLSMDYHVVATNPPYLGIRGMNEDMSCFLNKNYPESKYDLCTAYMDAATAFLTTEGYSAIINQQSWMFLSSFKKLRESYIHKNSIINMVHLGAKAFEENVGTIVQSVAFVSQKKSYTMDNKTVIYDVTKGDGSKAKEELFLAMAASTEVKGRYAVSLDSLLELPSQSFAYWIDKSIINMFNSSIPMEEVASIRQGMATSDNRRFVRRWYEVDINDINFNAADRYEAEKSHRKWFPYRKGGSYKKWYGNNDYVINWSFNGLEIKDYAKELYKNYTRTIKNEEYYFKSCITYTFISEKLGARYSPKGALFDVAGPSIFLDDDSKAKILLAFICSKVSSFFLDMINPTYNIQVGDLKKLPLNEGLFEKKISAQIEAVVDENIKISREIWNDDELSWDFNIHPLIKLKKETLRNTILRWIDYRNYCISRIRQNEEELNKIIIKIYGLEGYLNPEVDKEDITEDSIDEEKAVKSLISYAFGIIFERYSLKEYSKVTDNGFIQVCDRINCEDTMYNYLAEFVGSVFGDDTLEENLKYMGEVLRVKKGESNEKRLLRYIKNEFFRDHVKKYNGKPIYWKISSGKEGAFEGFVYYHGFRKEYLKKIYEESCEELLFIRNQIAFLKGKSYIKMVKMKEELERFQYILKGIIELSPEINLDEGIEKNYDRYKEILKKI